VSIIQTLIEEGVFSAWYDFRSGTVDDLSGNGNDGTFTGTPQFTRECLSLIDSASSVSMGTGFNSLNAVTVSGWVKIARIGSDQWLFSKHLNATDSWGVYVTAAGDLAIWDDIDNAGATLYSTAISVGEWHYVTAVIASDKEQLLYLDGVLIGSGTATADFWDSYAGEFHVGAITGATSPFNGQIRGCEIISRELDITEINNVMAETRAQRWPTKARARIHPIMSIDGNQTDLEAAYDMRPQGDRLIDASPNGNDGTINRPFHGQTLLGDHLFFDGVDDYVDCGTGMNVPDDATWEAWIRTTDANAVIASKWNAGVAKRGWALVLTTGRISLFISSTGANSEGEIDNSGVRVDDGVPHHVVAVYDKSENTVDFYVDGVFDETDTFTTTTGGIFSSNGEVLLGDEHSGGIGGFYAGDIIEFQMHRRKLTPAEIFAKYETSANAIQYKSDWGTPVSDAAVATGPLEDTGWVVDSGTFIVSTDTIEGQRVKVIECVTAGVVYLDMLQFMTTKEAAFGTWELRVLKANTADDLDMVFIADAIGGLEAGTQDGYGFRYMNTDDGIYLYETVGGGLTELGHFIGLTAAGSWYLLHLDRRVSGMFDMWIGDDSAVGSASDTTTVTGRYICLEMDAGGKASLSNTAGDYCIIKRLGVV